MQDLSTIQLICVWALPVIFAITVHEAAHGYVANYFGDRTAKMLGRLTLNPIKHIDPLGSIILPGILLILHTPFIFGWAKPVPVTERNLKHPRRDMAIIAVAGPLSNLTMAVIWALVSKIATFIPVYSIAKPMFLMGFAGIQINIILMLLNLLPIPPLDGSKVLNHFLTGKAAVIYDQIEPYGFIILLILIFTGILHLVLLPLFLYCIYFIKIIFML